MAGTNGVGRDWPPRQGPTVLASRATPNEVDEIVGLLQANEAPRGSLTGHFTHTVIHTVR
jgi:hypothetical protein